MQKQRVIADIAVLNGGAVAQAINEALLVAGKRLSESGQDQTISIEVKLSHTDVSPDILSCAHKVHVKEAAPKPDKSYVFLTPEGRLEVDQTIDANDPTLSQKVLPLSGRGGSE